MAPHASSAVSSPVVTAPGVRAAEAWLVAAVLEDHAAASRDPARLARPARIVVPSRSLRVHLAALLARRSGALLGVRVQTVRGLAREVLAHAGVALPEGEALLPVLVRRGLLAEPALAGALAGLEDVEGPVAAVVRDLLDAGYLPALAEAWADCAQAALPGAAAERARGLARVAERVARELEALGLATGAGLLARAREVLEREGEAALPARALWVHGISDATGVMTDWLEALVREAGATVLIAHPESATAPGRPAPGVSFTARLRARLGVPSPPSVGAAPAPPLLSLLCAPGAQAEVRAVARRVEALLARGVAPEAIGVVARELSGHRLALATHFRRLGIPFSGGVGFAGPEARRARALGALSELAHATPVDRWLDALGRHGRRRLGDLRLALHALGAGRLRDVAALDLDALLRDATSYRLPAVRGLVARAAEDGADGDDDRPRTEEASTSELPGRVARVSRRHVSRGALEEAQAAASQLLHALEEAAAPAPLDAHLARWRRILTGPLGLRPDLPGAGPLFKAVAHLADALPGELLLEGAELGVLLRRALGEAAAPAPLGGAGAGVSVLTVTEARGRSFEHLFVLGCNRDAFPRVATDDPLLPDALRVPLLQVLPDLPVRRRAADEERYLFAQLLSAAPEVTLSWQEVTDDGKERPPSPLVEHVRLATGLEPERAPALLEECGTPAPPRPAFEHALAGGATLGRAGLAAALPASLPPPRVAARLAVLDELEGRACRDAPGPYHGFVGAGPERLERLYVTRLERVAYCPWQTFLERELGLEPLPDALASLPDVTPLLLGQVVHDVLEQIVQEVGVPTRVALAEAGAPRDVPWPAAAELGRRVHAAAERAVREQGIVLPGFATLLARRAQPLVERVGALEATGGALRAVRGAELEGEVEVRDGAGGAHRLRFRADRVDSAEDGAWRLTDYKSGKPVSTASKPETRERHLLQQIAGARKLQAPAYAAAEGLADACGRYVFARPELSDEQACVEVRREDAQARDAFLGAVARVLDAQALGAFFPRLVQGRGDEANPFCEFCELADACSRDDSGARRRLRAWLAAEDAAQAPVVAARALFAMREKS